MSRWELPAWWAVGLSAFLALLFVAALSGCASTRVYHPMTGKPEIEVSTFVRQADVTITYDDPASTGWRRTATIRHEPLSPSMAGVLVVLGSTLGALAGPGGAVGGGVLGGALGMVLDAIGGNRNIDPTTSDPPPTAEAPPLKPDETGALPTKPAKVYPPAKGQILFDRPVLWSEMQCGGVLQPEWCP